MHILGYREVPMLRLLITEDQPLVIPGIVLQELLSGVPVPRQIQRLSAVMSGFPVLIASKQHHILAARIASTCRQAGVATSAIDCLIAAQTVAAAGELFTTDHDFRHMTPHCGLKLFRWE